MESNARIERLMREALGPPQESTHLPQNVSSILGVIALVIVLACAAAGLYAGEAEAGPAAPVHRFVGVTPAETSAPGHLDDMTF